MTTDPIATGETMDLGNLPELWRHLDQTYRRVMSLPDPAITALTARKFDEAQAAGHRAYIAAHRYLSVAMDNHRALIAVLEHHGATHSAPWSLLRPVFECSFFAAWMLDPIDGKQRRIRGLRCEVRDDIERRNHLRSFETVPEYGDAIREGIAQRRATVGAKYRAEAMALGVSWDTIQQKVNVVDELQKLRFVTAQGPLIRAMFVAQWRMLSGYEHGLGYALMRGSDARAQVEIPGGQSVILTVNDDAFGTAAQSSLWLMLEALLRLERLHTQP